MCVKKEFVQCSLKSPKISRSFTVFSPLTLQAIRLVWCTWQIYSEYLLDFLDLTSMNTQGFQDKCSNNDKALFQFSEYVGVKKKFIFAGKSCTHHHFSL